jgi:hypothetical protein
VTAGGIHVDQALRLIGAGADLKQASGRGIVAAQQIGADQRAVALQARERRAIEQPGAADGAIHDVVAEAIHNAADEAAPGDAARGVENVVEQQAGALAPGVEHVVEVAAIPKRADGLAGVGDHAVDEIGDGVSDPVHAEPVEQAAAAEDVQRAAAAYRADGLHDRIAETADGVAGAGAADRGETALIEQSALRAATAATATAIRAAACGAAASRAAAARAGAAPGVAAAAGPARARRSGPAITTAGRAAGVCVCSIAAIARVMGWDFLRGLVLGHFLAHDLLLVRIRRPALTRRGVLRVIWTRGRRIGRGRSALRLIDACGSGHRIQEQRVGSDQGLENA